jgi:hypothetical protein
MMILLLKCERLCRELAYASNAYGEIEPVGFWGVKLNVAEEKVE